MRVSAVLAGSVELAGPNTVTGQRLFFTVLLYCPAAGAPSSHSACRNNDRGSVLPPDSEVMPVHVNWRVGCELYCIIRQINISSFHEDVWGNGHIAQRIIMNSLIDVRDSNAYLTGHFCLYDCPSLNVSTRKALDGFSEI
jgi:hypothetical protein